MLIKDICMRCRESIGWWNSCDETRWQKGEIVCAPVTIEKRVTVKIADHPGDHCPYSLEHVVNRKPDEKPSKKSKAKQE